jgi:hypothetical protein
MAEAGFRSIPGNTLKLIVIDLDAYKCPFS